MTFKKSRWPHHHCCSTRQPDVELGTTQCHHALWIWNSKGLRGDQKICSNQMTAGWPNPHQLQSGYGSKRAEWPGVEFACLPLWKISTLPEQVLLELTSLTEEPGGVGVGGVGAGGVVVAISGWSKSKISVKPHCKWSLQWHINTKFRQCNYTWSLNCWFPLLLCSENVFP